MPSYDRKKIRAIISKDPEMSHRTFVSKSRIKISQSGFRYHRNAVLKALESEEEDTPLPRKRPYRRAQQRIYTSLWRRSTSELSEEAVVIIKDLVDELNRSGAVSWQLLEIADPPMLELREHTKP